jgi:hypothetical protein
MWSKMLQLGDAVLMYLNCTLTECGSCWVALHKSICIQISSWVLTYTDMSK